MQVFITGGSTGIGKSLGQLFVNSGAKVGVCSIQSPSEVTDLPAGFFISRPMLQKKMKLKRRLMSSAYSMAA
jgi:NAD(P)-dependent dehydrogenase (short-subunit alcohol dehydrogenase family)